MVNSSQFEQLEIALKNEQQAHLLTKQQSQERQRFLESKISDLNEALAITQRSLDEKSSMRRIYSNFLKISEYFTR